MEKKHIINIRIVFLLIAVVLLHKCSGHNVHAQPLLIPSENENVRYGYLNVNGGIVIDYQFMGALPFSEGLAAVQDGKMRVGYINTSGEYIISPQFESGGMFKQGYAVVITVPDHASASFQRTPKFVLIDKAGAPWREGWIGYDTAFFGRFSSDM